MNRDEKIIEELQRIQQSLQKIIALLGNKTGEPAENAVVFTQPKPIRVINPEDVLKDINSLKKYITDIIDASLFSIEATETEYKVKLLKFVPADKFKELAQSLKELKGHYNYSEKSFIIPREQ